MKILISGSYNVLAEYKIPGIYLASGLYPCSAVESPIYYGSSNNVYKRIAGHHISDLVGARHGNPPLNNYVKKYGIESLVWFLIEPCNLDNYQEREQNYLDTERPFIDEGRGFNVCKEVIGGRNGIPHTDETKRKISASKLGVTPNTSAETKKRVGEKLSYLFKGRHFHTNEALKKSFTLISPNGETVSFTGIAEFCRQNNLEASNLKKVINGKRKSHKGWRVT